MDISRPRLNTFSRMHVVIGKTSFDVIEHNNQRGRFMANMYTNMSRSRFARNIFDISQWAKEMFADERTAKNVVKLLTKPDIVIYCEHIQCDLTDLQLKGIPVDKPFNIEGH